MIIFAATLQQLLPRYSLLLWLLAVPTVAEEYRGCYGENRTYCFATTGMNSADGNGNSFLKTNVNAKAWCEDRGYRLVTVDSEEKHRAVVDFLLDHEYNTDSVWIGAGQVYRDSWTWVNGSVYTGNIYRVALVSFTANNNFQTPVSKCLENGVIRSAMFCPEHRYYVLVSLYVMQMMDIDTNLSVGVCRRPLSTLLALLIKN